MLTILSKSVSAKRVKNFRTHHWKSSNNLANTLTETFWNIRTPIRKFTFIEYLKMKVLFGYANIIELRCCYDAPGVFRDNLFMHALRAMQTDVPKSILIARLQLLQRLLGQPEWSQNLYYTYDNCFVYEIEENRRSIRKVKKYSGYVRNSSSVGSKRTSVRFIPEPEIVEWTTNWELDYYEFLTVGEFSSGLPGTADLILTSPQRTKR